MILLNQDLIFDLLTVLDILFLSYTEDHYQCVYETIQCTANPMFMIQLYP